MRTDRCEDTPIDIARSGRQAIDMLYQTAYNELLRIASSCRARDPFATLSTHTLLHEAWFKFGTAERLAIVDERHLKLILIRAMHQVLVDAARRRRAARRRGQVVALDAMIAVNEPPVDTILAVHEALARLAALDSVQAEVVEYRFFGGCTFEVIGAALGVSETAARRYWISARALLQIWFAEPVS